MKIFNVAIVGAGPGCLAIMDMIYRDRLRQVRMRLVGLADINPEAPAMKRARSLYILATNDYHDLFDMQDLDLIIELTGNKDVSRAIQHEKPTHLKFMDHELARLFWDLIQLEEEKVSAKKEIEECIIKERDNTKKILNNLSDAVIVMDIDYSIMNVNETFLKEFNFAREDVLGRSCFQIIFNRKFLCEDSFCPLSGFAGNRLKTRHKDLFFKRNGKTIFYDIDYRLIADESGGPSQWIITMRDVSHRKRLEIDLEKSRKKYKDLFDNAHEGLALFNDLGEVLENNSSLANMLGFSKEKFGLVNISDLAENHSKKILRDYLDDLKILGFTSVEMDFVNKNNDLLPVEANINWIDDDNLFRITVRDISIKKKLEESRRLYSEKLEKEVEERTQELKASEEETRRQKKTAEGIIYGSPIPMFVLDKNHRIIYWNKACEKLTGFSSEEMIGTSRQWEPFYSHKRALLADLIIEKDVYEIKKLYEDMHLRKSSVVEDAYEVEHFFPYLGSEGTHLYFNAAPIKDNSGNIQGASVTYQDFSERVKMTQEIERREAFVQNLIQNSIEGIIATDSRGRIVIFNHRAAEILGYKPSEIIGHLYYRKILPKKTGLAIRDAFYGDRYGPSGKIINMEVHLPNKAGEEIPVRVSGILLYERKKEVGSVVFFKDLREVHRLQKEKENAQRMAAIGRTVAGLAHYLKNILNGLKGGSYVINSAISKKDLDLMKQGWGMARRNINEIGSIVTDMLIYSSERKPSYRMVNGNDLALDVLEMIEERARLSGVVLVKDLAPELREVPMDKTGIGRCLLNLVSNAIDACTLEGITGGEGIVTIKTKNAPGSGLAFEVTDNGTGIDEETQKRLFTDFFSTKGYKGTGLGLPVTQEIVREHGGKLTFKSRIGQGTTFTLMLPGERTPII